MGYELNIRKEKVEVNNCSYHICIITFRKIFKNSISTIKKKTKNRMTYYSCNFTYI